jgi:hypothetical protein
MRLAGQALSQFGPPLAIVWAARLEVVGTIKDSPHHIPLGETDRMIADRIQYPAVIFAFRSGTGRAGGTVAKLRRPRRVGGPLLQ